MVRAKALVAVEGSNVPFRVESGDATGCNHGNEPQQLWTSDPMMAWCPAPQHVPRWKTAKQNQTDGALKLGTEHPERNPPEQHHSPGERSSRPHVGAPAQLGKY